MCKNSLPRKTSSFSLTQSKGKAIDFTSPGTSSGQASQPYEMVPIRTVLNPSEGERKPQGKTTRVKDIPHMIQSRSRTQ